MSALRSSAGRRGVHERRAQLGGDDVRERGLAEPGRAGEEHVVERLAAALRGLDEHRELVGHGVLGDEVRRVGTAAASGRGRRRGRRRACPRRPAPPPRGARRRSSGRGRCSCARRRPQRVADQVLGRLALGSVEQPLGLDQRVAEVDQALARQEARLLVGACRWQRRRRPPPARPRPSRAARRSRARRCACRRRARPGSACGRRARSPSGARAGCRPERIAIAIFGPTPETEFRCTKRSRSSSLAKP